MTPGVKINMLKYVYSIYVVIAYIDTDIKFFLTKEKK